MFRRFGTMVVCAVAIGACADGSAPTAVSPSASMEAVSGFPIFAHYVAMGTSISEGNAAAGVLAASQQQSWVSQLSRLAGHPMKLPLISGTGCAAPFAVPLITFTRISGEPVATPSDLLNCAPLNEGIVTPEQNVAITGATTLDALLMTPQTKPGVFDKKLYSRVLPPNTTQLGAMRMQNPRIVSVELGANEVLPAFSGVAIPGVTLVPFAVWAPLYHALVDSVAMVTRKGLLVGLTQNVANFPGMRRGDEIWRNRAALLTAFNVAVSSDCNSSVNLVFVPARVVGAVAIGLFNRQNGLPPVPFLCSDGGFGVVDYVLTPTEVFIVNALLAQMNAEIASTAVQHGFAHFQLEALYGLPNLKGPYSAVEQMLSKHPYGGLISADGVHPSAAGQSVLANAAAAALNATYQLGIPAPQFIAAR
ncbi:MAG: SGNH/GDSL hydrolase family protein [Gemmatimonadaceae bacterium]